jgi:D-serine deaminase-like pyridoxal phosphate-dependent protein
MELFAIPWHICPTVALHEQVKVIREGELTERWWVEARCRRLRF